MQFHEKLKRLSAGVNKSKAGEAVGLKANTISTYAATGSIPRSDIGIKIARALGCSAEWLFDDEQDWPPPAADSRSASALSDLELMTEAHRRYRLAALRIRESLSAAEKIDWLPLAKACASMPPGEPLPSQFRRELSVFEAAGALILLSLYDASEEAPMHRDGMPGADVDPDELKRETLQARALSIRESNVGFHALDTVLSMRMSWRGWPEERDDIEAYLRKLSAQLQGPDASNAGRIIVKAPARTPQKQPKKQ